MTKPHALNTKQLQQLIVETIETEKPQTTQQLITIIQQKTALPKEKINQALLQLENTNKITFTKPQPKLALTLKDYASSRQALWFWVCIGFAAVTVASLLIPEDAYPAAYIRSTLAVMFALFLPGFSLTKTLFPLAMSFKLTGDDTDKIERFVVSLGLSLALLPIFSLLLNYTPWGIRLTPLAISVLLFTLAFSTAGLIREYQAKNPTKVDKNPRMIS